MMAQAVVSSLQQGLPALGPLFRETFDLSLPALGALLATASWGVMLTIYIWGRLADRWGERIVVVIGSGGATIALIGATFPDSAWGLGLSICVAGAMSGSAIAASGRAVMGWFPRSERGLALGLRQMAVPIGAGLAGIALPAIAVRFGLDGAFLALAVLAFAGAIVGAIYLGPPPPALTSARSPQQTAGSPVRDTAIWRLSGAAGLLQWSQVGMNTFLMVILVEHQGLGYAAAAILFACVQALSGVMRVAAGWLSDRKGRRVPHFVGYAVAIAISLLAAAAFQLVHSPVSVAALLLASVLSFSWNGLAFAAVAEFSGIQRAGAAFGFHGTLMRLMSLPTAILFGWLSAHTGWSVALALLAVFPVAGAILILPLIAEEERRNPFAQAN
jgi:sugar phosphate permease